MKNLLLLMGLIVLISCSLNRITKEWGSVEINSEIKSKLAYKLLSSELEIFNYNEVVDSSQTKSSGIDYVVKDIDFNIENNYSARCVAILKNDLLEIRTIYSNGFGGEGFIIYYKNGKFLIKEAGYSDVLSLYEPKQEIVYQNLVLDKTQYSNKDSIYGYVDFKIKKTDFDNYKSLHSGKGYFRTKIINN